MKTQVLKLIFQLSVFLFVGCVSKLKDAPETELPNSLPHNNYEISSDRPRATESKFNIESRYMDSCLSIGFMDSRSTEYFGYIKEDLAASGLKTKSAVGYSLVFISNLKKDSNFYFGLGLMTFLQTVDSSDGNSDFRFNAIYFPVRYFPVQHSAFYLSTGLSYSVSKFANFTSETDVKGPWWAAQIGVGYKWKFSDKMSSTIEYSATRTLGSDAALGFAIQFLKISLEFDWVRVLPQ